MSAHKKLLGFLALLGIAWVGMHDGFSSLLLPAAHAQVPVVLSDAMRTNIQSVLSFLIQVFSVLAFLLFALLNFLLDPVIIFNLGGNGAAGALDQMLNDIWRLSRDLVNLIFAVSLIGVAIYTVITANKEVIMTHAAKFVMAVVLVNFSWFVPRVILDVANVMTATVYGIPSLLGNNITECRYPAGVPPPAGEDCQVIRPTASLCRCSAIVDIRFFQTAAWIAANRGPYDCELQFVCFKKEVLNINAVAGHSAILNGLIINHARLKNMAIVPPRGGGGDQFLNLLIRLAIILLIEMAIVFPLAAMVVVFFIRIPVLWLTISFMPFVLVGWVIDDQYTQGAPKKIMSHFIKAAFVPAVVAVPLAVGYMLINAGAQQVGVGGVDAFNNMIELPTPIIAGVGTLWQIVWLLMSLMIMYTGVFSAINAMNYEGGLGEFQGRQIQKIQDTGRIAGGVATQAAGMIPIPMAGGMTLGQALGALRPRNIAERMRQTAARPPGGGGGGLTEAQKREAATAATAASAPGAPISADELRNRVRLAGSGNADDVRRLREALNQLNPNLRAQTLTGEQLVQALQHIESGAHGNRIRVDIATHADGIRRGAGGAPPAPPPPPPPRP